MKHALAIILVGLVLIFCSPLKALSESETVVAADDIMIKMRLGLPVEYENAVIKGNLTSDRLGMTAKQILRIPLSEDAAIKQMQVNSSVVIKNSIICGRVDFNNTQFHKQVRFVNVFFVEYALFVNSTFNDDAAFDHSIFLKEGSFEGSRFDGKANFFQTRFNRRHHLMALNLAALLISPSPSSTQLAISPPANSHLMPSLIKQILKEKPNS